MDMKTPVRSEPASAGSTVPRSFGSQISLISRLLRKRFDERARTLALGEGEALTQAQWRALASIYLHEGCTQKTLAEKLEIGPVAMGQTIDRLERLKWVTRRADPGDRRVKRLHPTQEALPVLERLGVLADSENHYAAISLPPNKMQALMSMLDEVIESLSRSEPG